EWASAEVNAANEAPEEIGSTGDVRVDGSGPSSNGDSGHEPPSPPPKSPTPKNIAFTNLKKIYWPAEKYTKGDLIEYYRAVSKWMLPYLANRPVVLTRFPDGIDGKSFYQKDAPVFAPDW